MAIHKLPPEVLRLVFLHYTKRTAVGKGHNGLVSGLSNGSQEAIDVVRSRQRRKPVSTPFHLSLVCRGWHSTVTRDPLLWSTIHIHCPVPSDVPIVELWLQRSGNELLSISLHESFNDGLPLDFSDIPMHVDYFESEPLSQQKRALSQIIQLTIGASQRWRVVSFSMGEDVGRVFQTDAFHNSSFPNLESFEIDMRDAGGSPQGDPSAGALPPIHTVGQRLSASPALRSASWSSYIDSEIRKYVPFSRLTSLSLGTIAESEATLILSCCQELQTLLMRQYQASATLTLQLGCPVELPKLRVASLGFFCDATTLPSFFSVFVAPVLCELSLERGFGRSSAALRVVQGAGLGIGDEMGWKGLISFLERSGCGLERLAYCPDVELSERERGVMRESLKDRVFSGLIEHPRTRRSGQGMSNWGGMGL